MRTTLFFAFILLTTTLSAQRLEKMWSTPKELKTPESVLYSDQYNVAFVSCIGEKKDSADGDGYIAQINLQGEITNSAWVKGLNDPKGMAIWNDKLYVADMKELVIIDIKTAKVDKKILAPEAKFLNDVTVSSAGIVFVSDMKDQSIYSYQDELFSVWRKDVRFENVNGLWAENETLYAGNASVLEIDIPTKRVKELFRETGGIDGLEKIGDKDYIFSNWGGRIFISRNGNIMKLLDTSEQSINTADIDFIPRKSIVLVPTFFGNSVDAYRLLLN